MYVCVQAYASCARAREPAPVHLRVSVRARARVYLFNCIDMLICVAGVFARIGGIALGTYDIYDMGRLGCVGGISSNTDARAMLRRDVRIREGAGIITVLAA